MIRDIDAPAGRRSRQPSRRFSYFRAGAVLAAACLALTTLPARADVFGIGDILPSKPDPDNPGPPPGQIPDLPIGGGTVTANGGEIIVGGTEMGIGGTDTGQMVIDIPAFTAPLVSDTGVIGGAPEGSGLVQIFSLGSLWQIGARLTVAEFGQGTLELINGGQLSESPNAPAQPSLDIIVGQEVGSQGFVNLTGNGSLMRSDMLTIGEGGFGQMTLKTRARVNTLTEAIIGTENSGPEIGTGNVSVDGQLTRWTIGSVPTTGATLGGPGRLVVGSRGRGALTVTNQGEVRVSDKDNVGGTLIIGEFGNSFGEVVVDGAFSQLWSFGTINVGGPNLTTNNARGVLRVTNGGLARANQAIGVGIDGVLEISGGTVLTPVGINNNGTIQTAVGSTGQIDSIVTNMVAGEIRSAGTVDRVRERLIFTRNVANAGLITSIGGEMEFTAAVDNTGGLIAGRDAIYRFRDPFTNAGAMSFSVGVSDVFGTIVNNGTVGVAHSTDVTFYDPFTNNGNLTVLPGGAAIFLNGLTFGASSALSLQLNEVASVEEIGQLQIVGSAALGGSLNLLSFSGLTPQPGDSYTLISGTTITGTFSSVVFPPAPGNNWDLDYTPNSVVLNFISAPSFNADWNGDGIVTGADLALWTANFGTMVPPGTLGDANFDGVVDGSDFGIWQRQLGTMPVIAAGGPAAGSVPEPASAALLLTALACAARRRNRPSAP